MIHKLKPYAMVLLSTASIAAAQEDARFVSLTPDKIQPADPSYFMDNEEALGGAQFFWAPPETDSEGNEHLSSLVGAKMGIVHPYQLTEKEEKEGKEIRFCWGRLENLLYTDSAGTKYWVRPTTSFFAIQSPCLYDEKQEKDKKLHLNFRDYHYFLDANKGNKDSFASVYNTMGEHEKKAMNIQDPFRGKPKGENDRPGMYGNLDFNSCPWGDMLERRKTKVNESADIKYVTDYLTSLASLVKEKKLDKNSKWMNYWSVTIGAGSRRDYGKRKELLPYWRDEPYQILNKTKGSFDGWLCLKDYTTFKWDCAKIEQAGTSFNFLPLSGHVAKFSAGGTIEQKPDRELRAVVASVSHRQEDRPGFVVAILADWDRSASQVDAITVNQCFNPNGGTIKSDKSDCSVRVPEYTRVALHKDAADENTGFLNVTFNEQKIAQVSWQGGKVLRLLNEEIQTQSPIVYEANCKNREIKAVVALPAETAEEIINSRGIEALALSDIRGESFMDGNNTAAWAKCSPVNMSQSWRMQGKYENLAHDIKLLNSTSNSPNGQNGKVLEGYNLYLVTMSFDSTCPRIAAGEMYNEWHFTSSKTSDKLSLPTVTNLCKVYTIFGESTWPKSGEVVLGESKPQQENAILPWERMLNYVTRLCLCDKNCFATEIDWNNEWTQKGLSLKALTYGISRTADYPLGDLLACEKTYPLNNVRFFNGTYDKTRTNSSEHNSTADDEEIKVRATFEQYTIYGQGRKIMTLEKPKHFMNFDMERFLDDSSSESYLRRVRNMICVDTACILSIFPRICGFPDTIFNFGVGGVMDFPLDGESTEGHQFNTYIYSDSMQKLYQALQEEPAPSARGYKFFTVENLKGQAVDAFVYDATCELDGHGKWILAKKDDTKSEKENNLKLQTYKVSGGMTVRQCLNEYFWRYDFNRKPREKTETTLIEIGQHEIGAK